MNKILSFSSIVCVSLLSSCGFLMSPIGEELIMDGAQEVIKLEQQLTHTTAPTIVKDPVKETSKEPTKETK